MTIDPAALARAVGLDYITAYADATHDRAAPEHIAERLVRRALDGSASYGEDDGIRGARYEPPVRGETIDPATLRGLLNPAELRRLGDWLGEYWGEEGPRVAPVSLLEDNRTGPGLPTPKAEAIHASMRYTLELAPAIDQTREHIAELLAEAEAERIVQAETDERRASMRDRSHAFASEPMAERLARAWVIGESGAGPGQGRALKSCLAPLVGGSGESARPIAASWTPAQIDDSERVLEALGYVLSNGLWPVERAPLVRVYCVLRFETGRPTWARLRKAALAMKQRGELASVAIPATGDGLRMWFEAERHTALCSILAGRLRDR